MMLDMYSKMVECEKKFDRDIVDPPITAVCRYVWIGRASCLLQEEIISVSHDSRMKSYWFP